jgi:hypothetical protein
MTRKKGKMSIETFERTLQIMKNKYVGLHHFGEPLLHPLLPDFITLAKRYGIRTEFSTNGDPKVKGRLESIMQARPYLIRYAYDAFKDLSFLKRMTELNQDTIIRTHSVEEGTKPFTNFAGAVEGESQIKGECYFKKYDYFCVLCDGRVVPCCCDYDGENILGDVFYSGEIKHKKTYPMCSKCEGMQFTERGLWWQEI